MVYVSRPVAYDGGRRNGHPPADRELQRVNELQRVKDDAMRMLGRGMQLTAMILLPLSMVLELGGGLGRSFGVSDMVVMLVFGIGLFLIGRLVEGFARA